MQKKFLNLTNGIEAIERYSLDISEVNFIRIQSTHCEQFQFERILLELDNNFLMWLALGYECIIYDFGAAGSETSKAVYHGVEWIKYVLNKRWFGKDTIPYVRGKMVLSAFQNYYSQLSRKTKRRIDYFKDFLLATELNLVSITSASSYDGQKEKLAELIKTYIT